MSSNFRAEQAFKMHSMHQAHLLYRGDLIANLLSAQLPSAADNGLFKVKADRQRCFPLTSDFSSPLKLLESSLNSSLSVRTAHSAFGADRSAKATPTEFVSIRSLVQAVDFLVPDLRVPKIKELSLSKQHESKIHNPSVIKLHDREVAQENRKSAQANKGTSSLQEVNLQDAHLRKDSLSIQEDNFKKQRKFDPVFEQAQGLDRPVSALLQQWLQHEKTDE